MDLEKKLFLTATKKSHDIYFFKARNGGFMKEGKPIETQVILKTCLMKFYLSRCIA